MSEKTTLVQPGRGPLTTLPFPPSEAREREWPPQSGIIAPYTVEEENLVGSLIALCDAGKIGREQLAREVGILHEMKATFDARLLPEPKGRWGIPAVAADQLADEQADEQAA